MKILISTDTSCLVSENTFSKYDISVFPLNVIIDGVEYLDGVSIKQDQLYSAMKEDKMIKTSTPPMGVVIEYFEELFAKGYDKIIHFTISSKFSSMYSLFSTVSSSCFDDKIIVVDAYSVSTVMLAQVFLAYDLVSQGVEIDEILKRVEDIKLNSKLYCVPENLTSLKKGGRISPAIAMIGNTLGLKPVIQLTDGELVKDNMARNVRNAFYAIIDEFIASHNYNDYDFTLIEFGGKEVTVNHIESYLVEKVTENNVLKGLIPINVCAHCGPGTIGLVITKKINNKSLKDFI